jgi:hypothetical protein
MPGIIQSYYINLLLHNSDVQMYFQLISRSLVSKSIIVSR